MQTLPSSSSFSSWGLMLLALILVHDVMVVDALVDALVDMRDRCYCHLDDMGNSRPMVATHTPAMARRCSFKVALVCGRQKGKRR